MLEATRKTTEQAARSCCRWNSELPRALATDFNAKLSLTSVLVKTPGERGDKTGED